MDTQDIKWKLRFNNFKNAFVLLKKCFNEKKYDDYSDIEKLGVIKIFELVFELSYKMIDDYIIYSGINLSEKSLRSIIKNAFSLGIVCNTEKWLDMLSVRNFTAYQYSNIIIKEYLEKISNSFISEFNILDHFFSEKENKNSSHLHYSDCGLPDDAIEEIRGVFSSHAFVQKAWLCGSRAQGLAKHNSDIDLALEGEISVDELGKIHSLLESLPLPYLFDIVDKSKITDESFLEHINTYGKLIYSK